MLPYVFKALTQMCNVASSTNKTYVGTWINFIRSLNFFIVKPIPWVSETENDIMKQKAFFYIIEV